MQLEEYRQRVERHLPSVIDLLQRIDQSTAFVYEPGEESTIAKVLRTHLWDDTLHYLAVAGHLEEGERTDAIVLEQIQRHCAATHIETVKVILSFLPKSHALRNEFMTLLRTAYARAPMARRAES